MKKMSLASFETDGKSNVSDHLSKASPSNLPNFIRRIIRNVVNIQRHFINISSKNSEIQTNICRIHSSDSIIRETAINLPTLQTKSLRLNEYFDVCDFVFRKTRFTYVTIQQMDRAKRLILKGSVDVDELKMQIDKEIRIKLNLDDKIYDIANKRLEVS